MTIREVTRKLRAWEAGRPLPRYETIHHFIAPEKQALIVAFVRMAGESRPWGIAWGQVGDHPTVASVPDGRVRDDVSALCADLAEALLAHLRVHNWTYDPVDRNADVTDLRQVWLPNGRHVAMLHQLSYTYSQTRFGGANQEILRALGRLAGWMFRDTCRRGSQHVVNASQALADAYTFPAQDTRTAHVGYQLAWLSAMGDRDKRLSAAAAAEQLTVSPTMDPSLERNELSTLVTDWQTRRRERVPGDEVAARIAAILGSELERRWKLGEHAYRSLSNDERPVNSGVPALVKQAHEEFWFQHQRIELRHNDPSQGPAFVAHPETDFHGSAAASGYLIHASFDEAHVGHLIHSDPELFKEALDDGRAIQGTVLAVRDLGAGRRSVPIWDVRISADAPNRLRENGRLAPYGSRGHEVSINSLDVQPDSIDVQLEWIGRKTMALECGLGAKPVDASWVGQEVAFVVSDASDLTRRRSSRVWRAKDGPGAWLTHGAPPPPIEIDIDDSAVDLLVDDIRQIEDGAET